VTTKLFNYKDLATLSQVDQVDQVKKAMFQENTG
jgi:hypothetical protein